MDFGGKQPIATHKKFYQRVLWIDIQYVTYIALLQEPTAILFGTEWEWINERGQHKLSEVKHYGYTVDLFAGLEVTISSVTVPAYYVHVYNIQALLNNPDVLQEVITPHHSSDEFIRDFCDAQEIKDSEVFENDPSALQLLLYYDEIEVANPLGAKAGMHKLGTHA